MLLHLKWRVDFSSECSLSLASVSHPFWMQPALQEWMVWNELGCWFLEDLNQDQMVVVFESGDGLSGETEGRDGS